MNIDYKNQVRSSINYFNQQIRENECDDFVDVIKKYCDEIKMENDTELKREIFYKIGGIIAKSPKLDVEFIQEVGIIQLAYLHLQIDFEKSFELFVMLFIELTYNNKEIIDLLISTQLFQVMIYDNNYSNQYVQKLLVQMVSYNKEITNILIEQYNISDLIVDKSQIPLFYSNLLYTCDENNLALVKEAILNIINDINNVDNIYEMDIRINSLNHIFNINGKYIVLILDSPLFNNILELLNSNNPKFIFKVLTLFRVFVNSDEEEILVKFCIMVPLQTFFKFIKYDSNEISQTSIAIISDIIAEKIYSIHDYINMNLVEIINYIFINGTFTHKKFGLYCLINLSLYFRENDGDDTFNYFIPKDGFEIILDFIISNDCLNDPSLIYGLFHIFNLINIDLVINSNSFNDFYDYLQNFLIEKQIPNKNIKLLITQLCDLFEQ